jgi:hypothetical protein
MTIRIWLDSQWLIAPDPIFGEVIQWNTENATSYNFIVSNFGSTIQSGIDEEKTDIEIRQDMANLNLYEGGFNNYFSVY